MHLGRIGSVFIFLIIIVFQSACSDISGQKEIRIATSPWIGYSPLIYAFEKGWLEKENIKLVFSTSLHETIHFHQAGLVDGFTSTQFDVAPLKREELLLFMPLDRSYDADVILSNKSLDALLLDDTVSVYLELESVNKHLFDAFVKKYDINISKYTVYNKEQITLKNLKSDDAKTMLVVSYEPYASLLRHKGFDQISSAKDSDTLILDALYLNKKIYDSDKNRLERLKLLIIQAYTVFKDDPDEYYGSVKKHFEGQSKEEFIKSGQMIDWLIDAKVK
ncbi:hypothetical protein KJ877_08660 [bacterium]|nr:hypothetical protein [bacterium]MBU1990767.1 hypothetical protein [bacterium]